MKSYLLFGDDGNITYHQGNLTIDMMHGYRIGVYDVVDITDPDKPLLLGGVQWDEVKPTPTELTK